MPGSAIIENADIIDNILTRLNTKPDEHVWNPVTKILRVFNASQAELDAAVSASNRRDDFLRPLRRRQLRRIAVNKASDDFSGVQDPIKDITFIERIAKPTADISRLTQIKQALIDAVQFVNNATEQELEDYDPLNDPAWPA